MEDRRDLLAGLLRRITAGTESALETPAANREAWVEKAASNQYESEAALRGWKRIEADEALSNAEMSALEAIVLPMHRPVIDIIDDSFKETPEPWQILDKYRKNLEAAIRSIGRVEIPGHPSTPYGGTGFIVGPRLIMTNRHVAELFISGLGVKNLLFRPGRSSALDLKMEAVASEPILLKARAARLVHPYWDMAIIEVDGLKNRKPLSISAAEPADLKGRRAAIIGYPAMDYRNDLELQNRIFRGIYGRKRLQPGTVMGYEKTVSFSNTVEVLAHDCSTLGGNSGSALIDLETGEVIGLHFAGLYLKANYAVPTWELALDPKAADLGVNFTKSPEKKSKPEWINVWTSLEAELPKPSKKKAKSETLVNSAEYLRIGADWFERADDAQIAIALRNDNEKTRALIEQTLRPNDAAELINNLQEQPAEEGLFWNDPDPDLPEIVFLHGIMGGHLAHQGGLNSRVWLNPLAFLIGDLAEKLALAQDGERDAAKGQFLKPDGHIRLVYASAARQWRKLGFIVHEFSFDWRKSVTKCADRLHHFIENLSIDRPGRMFMIVAHSMGGLVACLYAHRHAEWSDRIQRAVFMGSPLQGSYAPIEAVIGSYPFLHKLAFVSRKDDMDDLRRMAATLPGLIDMLPHPQVFPDAARTYSQNRWPDSLSPAQRWLDQSKSLKPVILQSPVLDRTTLLVSLGHGTVCSLVEQDGSIWRGPRDGAGDGTVPARSAVVEGIPAFKVSYTHDSIPKDPDAVQAVYDLTKTGFCSLDPVKPEDLLMKFVEAPAAEFPEGLAENVRKRFEKGIYTQADLEWLLSPNLSNVPEA